MSHDKEQKDTHNIPCDEGEKEDFSFLQETIKKESKKKTIFMQSLKIGIFGFLFGICFCLGFFALKPWASKQFQEEPEQVSIPEDEKPKTKELSPCDLQVVAPLELNADNFNQMMESIYNIAKQASRSIVSVESVYEKEEKQSVKATGLIVADQSQELLILCGNLVCPDATSWKVTFSDNRTYIASLKKQDKISGLAVFSIPRHNIQKETWDYLEVASLGNSNFVTKGEFVMALGNLYDNSEGVGYGVISSNEQYEVRTDRRYDVIATDISATASGTGVIFNLGGDVIGMIDPRIVKDTDATFAKAIAISDLKSTIEFLVNGESVPCVGITGATVDSKVADQEDMPPGVYVTQVQPDSPAMSAGIQSGDIIYEIAGVPVTELQSYERVVYSCKKDQVITAKGKRLGADGYVNISFTITIGSNE